MTRRQIAWILILVVDAGYVAWGAMAATMPDQLAGPGGNAILPAGYEGYSGASWPELLRTSPITASYMIVLFRMYGIYNVIFGLMGSAIAVTAFRHGERWAWLPLLAGNTIALVSAMRYDWIVNAIGRGLLPSARHQRHRRCLPDDVRRRRRRRARVPAMDPETHWRIT